MKGAILALCVVSAFADGVPGSAYTVSVVPSLDKTLSSSKVHIRLNSESSHTDPLELGEHFLKGEGQSTVEYIEHLDNELPTGLQLVTEGWNGLNFVTVDHSGDVSQFQTSYFSAGGAPTSTDFEWDGENLKSFAYDSVFTQASGASCLSTPCGDTTKDYTVQFRTGFHAEAGSQSPMYIQFEGENGKSRFYLLGTQFLSGHVQTATIKVAEDIGALGKIELRAGGPDSWNCVNFIEVGTPTSEWIQFETNVFLTQLPADETGKIGIFPQVRSASIDAVNNEGTGSDESVYQLSFQTGNFSNAASSSPMFVQLQGNCGTLEAPNQCHSNFIKLGEDFQAGQRTIVDVKLFHPVGLLETINLQAGGSNGWCVVGDFSVKTPNDAQVHFQTDFFMDERPFDPQSEYEHIDERFDVYDKHTVDAVEPEPPTPCTTRGQHACCGNGICDATEDTGNCPRDCVNSGWQSLPWGNQESPDRVDTSYTHGNVHENEQQWTDHGSHDGVLTTTVTPGAAFTPTPSPTLAPARPGCRPTAGHCADATDEGSCNAAGHNSANANLKQEGCEWDAEAGTCGAKTLPDGWTMAGMGENYCNYCKCDGTDVGDDGFGTITCSNKECGVPTTPENDGWSTCEHITCKLDDSGRRIKVKSTAQSDGSVGSGQHKCAYNENDSNPDTNCNCMCKMDATGYNAGEVGRADIARSGFSLDVCEKVSFKSGFDPQLGKPTVVVSASHSNSGNEYAHDAAIVWVEATALDHFVVCAREDKKHWNTDDSHSHRLNVEYYAYQGKRRTKTNTLVQDYNKPFIGAHAGVVENIENDAAGVHCVNVDYTAPRPFDRVPIVIGTVDYDNDNWQAEQNHAVTHWIDNINTQQFRVCFREIQQTEGSLAPFKFNWFAVEHRNPELHATNHFGYAAAGTQASKGLWTEARPDKEGTAFNACADIHFGEQFEFTHVPAVLVEGRHQKAGADFAASQSPATISYVDKVFADHFRVCSTALLAYGDNQKDEDLVWNWIAFERNGPTVPN